jgi:transposase
MPGRTRPPYPAAFREQMVELVKAGRSPEELAVEFGCSAQSIHNWLARSAIPADARSARSVAITQTEREELIRLRREVRRLQMERDILAKATAWFANKDEKASTSSSS